MFCAYLRYVVDDVAWYQLPVYVRQRGRAVPSCRVVQRRVRRAGVLRLRCVNLPAGAVRVRFARAGARPRTVRARVAADGKASVRVRLRSGTYRVTVVRGTTTLGQRRALRILR